MRVGIELEVIGNRATALRAIREAGVAIYDEGYNHDTRRHWKIVNDASVSRGFEVVSPILESDNAGHMADVKKVCDALVTSGCTVDRSCGFHVHCDASGITPAGFKTLVKVFAKFEPVMDSFMPASRRNNHYCASILRAVAPGAISASDPNFPVILQQFFQRVDRCRDLRGMYSMLMASRYFKLNLDAFWKHGTVEFRQHSGTTDAAKVLNWIEFCTGMVDRCMREHTRVTIKGAASLDTLFKAVRRPGLKRFYRTRAEILAGGPVRAGNDTIRAALENNS